MPVEFGDIFFVIIIPLVTAVIVGLGVNYLARTRARTQSRLAAERAAELEDSVARHREEASRLRELADARALLLRSWQEERLGPLEKLREDLGLDTLITIDEEPRGLDDDAEERFRETVEELEQFRSVQIPIHPPVALNIGLIHYAAGRREEAVASFEEVLEGDATNAEARSNLGYIYLRLRRFERALEQFQALLELEGHRFEGHFGLGLAAVNLGRFDEGIEALSTAIRLRPEFARTYCELGHAYAETGELERARESAKVALKLNPEMEEGELLLQRIRIKAGDFDEAIAACRRSLAKRDSHRAFYNLAVAYAMKDDLEAAIDALRRAVQLDDQTRFAAKDDPAFAPLRDSRRFRELLEGRPGLF